MEKKAPAAKKVAKMIVFDFGDKVEFNNKLGKDEGIVGNVRLYPGGVLYSVTWSDKRVLEHYEFELKLRE